MFYSPKNFTTTFQPSLKVGGNRQETIHFKNGKSSQNLSGKLNRFYQNYSTIPQKDDQDKTKQSFIEKCPSNEQSKMKRFT